MPVKDKDVVSVPTKLLQFRGVGGAYNPIVDSIILADEKDYSDFNSVYAHEKTHQFQAKGGIKNLATPEGKGTGRAMTYQGKPLVEYFKGYPNAVRPGELYATMVESSVASDSALPPEVHPAFGGMTDAQKLWYLKNRNGWMTDQAFLRQGAVGELANRAKAVQQITEGIGESIATKLKSALLPTPKEIPLRVRKEPRGVLNYKPQQGGLSATNLPTPFGLRAYMKPDGSYGGEMMPKGYGWLGPQVAKDGSVMTEYSLEDDTGMYPSLVRGTTPENLKLLLNGIVTPEQAELARNQAEIRRGFGLSPFKEIWEE